MGGDAALARSSKALPIPDPASSMEAMSSSIMAVSRRPSFPEPILPGASPAFNAPETVDAPDLVDGPVPSASSQRGL